MLIRCGYKIRYVVPKPTVFLLMLHLRPEYAPKLRSPEKFAVEPGVPYEFFLDTFGNRCVRLLAPGGSLELSGDVLVKDRGWPSPVIPEAREHTVDELPPGVLGYLLPSRYCEVDLLGDVAWTLFGRLTPGWTRVQAICDWVHRRTRFDYAHARDTRTARQTYDEQVGVCRDFTHLAIALCRCLNIPARYVTGYLGDIGVAPDPAPMDFSACMEVYLGGEWHIFDVRHNVRRIGYLVLAHGRDAADVALTTSFGPHRLERFVVITEEVPAACVAA